MWKIDKRFEYRWLGDDEWKVIAPGDDGVTRLLLQDGLDPACEHAAMRDGSIIRLHDMELRIRTMRATVRIGESVDNHDVNRPRVYHDGKVFVWLEHG